VFPQNILRVIGEDSFFVACYASDEKFLPYRSWLAGPRRHRRPVCGVRICKTKGKPPPIAGNGLLGALAHFGLDGIGVGEKEEMRRLVLSSGLWSGRNVRRSSSTAKKTT